MGSQEAMKKSWTIRYLTRDGNVVTIHDGRVLVSPVPLFLLQAALNLRGR